jgi:hypothetical protein
VENNWRDCRNISAFGHAYLEDQVAKSYNPDDHKSPIPEFSV